MNFFDYLLPIFLGFFGHIILNLILRYFLSNPFIKKCKLPKDEIKKYNGYLSNYTCIFHAVSMAIFGLYSMLTIPYDVLRPMKELEIKFLTFSIAYNVYDIIYEKWANLLNVPLLGHHLIMIVLNIYSIFADKNACVLNVIYFVGEITNPILCISQNTGAYENSKFLSKILGFIFCVLFLFNRIFISTYYLFVWNSDQDISYLFVFVFSFMFFISYQWSFQTFNKLFKLIRNFKNRDGKDDTTDDFYSVTNSLRYNKKFNIAYQTFLATLCFGPLFFFKHKNLY